MYGNITSSAGVGLGTAIAATGSVYNSVAHIIFGAALVFVAIGLRAALPSLTTVRHLIRGRGR